jgi:hypothetical protein
MSPYQRHPRRHFSNQMKNPYFHSKHYQEEHTSTEVKIEKAALSFIHFFKKIFSKK